MAENGSNFKKYAAVLVAGVLGGWYCEARISEHMYDAKEKTQGIRDGVETVFNAIGEYKPDLWKDKIDNPIYAAYEKITGKKVETVDDKVQNE